LGERPKKGRIAPALCIYAFFETRSAQNIAQGIAGGGAHTFPVGRFIARMPGYDECVEPTLNDIRPGH
jgi:hypothetical protein